MNKRIGPKQRPIIDAMKAGGTLFNEGGNWSLREIDGKWYTINRERCMGLYVRGFIMSTGTQTHFSYTGGYRTAYELTEEGKRV